MLKSVVEVVAMIQVTVIITMTVLVPYRQGKISTPQAFGDRLRWTHNSHRNLAGAPTE